MSELIRVRPVVSHIDLLAFFVLPFFDTANTVHLAPAEVKEIIKCLFKSNLSSSDRGTRHNGKRQDSLSEGGKGECCLLMDFVKKNCILGH